MSIYSSRQQIQPELFQYDPRAELEKLKILGGETWRNIARAWEALPAGYVKTLLFRKIHADRVINREDLAITGYANRIRDENLSEPQVRELVMKCEEGYRSILNRVKVLGGGDKGVTVDA